MDETALPFRNFLHKVKQRWAEQHSEFDLLVLKPGDDIGEFEAFVSEQFRMRQQDYMLSGTLRQIEMQLAIAERSTHFVLYNKNRPVAALRALPAPFELNALADLPAELNASIAGHVEFSRLISDEATSKPGQGVQLIAEACAWAMASGYAGVVAISRRSQKRMFSRFGLRAANEHPFSIATRGTGDYWLMTGSWAEISVAGGHSSPVCEFPMIPPSKAHSTGQRSTTVTPDF